MDKKYKILEIWIEVPVAVKTKDWWKIQKIVDENPDTTQKELGELYGGAS